MNKRYWLKWTIACGLGEFFGIGVAAGIGFSLFTSFGEPDTLAEKLLLILIMVCAGIIEGLVTGSFQWAVLRKRFADMKAKNWLFFTASGAAAGWLLGMIPSIFITPAVTASSPAVAPSGTQIALSAIMAGIVLGAIFGLFQWLELRKHALNAGRWIGANSLGWLVGLPLIFIGASLPSADMAIAVVILIGIISGLLAGLSVGAITGIYLIRLNMRK